MKYQRIRVVDEQEVNITPLLDIVFILLIFFMVTATFNQEEGLPVNPSQVQNPDPRKSEIRPAVVWIDQANQISMDNRSHTAASLRDLLWKKHVDQPEARLVIAAHPDAQVDGVIKILDMARDMQWQDTVITAVDGI